jgi:tetratricopeptide (TPR) repeat protein
MRRELTSLVLVLFLLLGGAAFSQERESLNWLLYEQGNASLALREFGQALQYYKLAISSAGIFPEAEMAIGDVYLAEGEFELAIGEYVKAYNQRKAFYIFESQYDALYKLAHLYEGQELYKLMEDRLTSIVADDKHFIETANSHLRTQIEKNYLEKGIDHVLVLYRFEDSFAAKAHSKLGWFYYRTGRFSQSMSNLLYSVIYGVSEVNAYLRERDVNYQFASLQDVLTAADKSNELRRFISEIELYKDLYYLAGATFADGYPQHSLALWGLLSGFGSSGEYQGLSRRQLKSPWVEPLIGATGKTEGG